MFSRWLYFTVNNQANREHFKRNSSCQVSAVIMFGGRCMTPVNVYSSELLFSNSNPREIIFSLLNDNEFFHSII